MELCGAFKYGTSTLFYVVYFLRSVLYVNGLEQYPTNHDRPLPDKVSQPGNYLFFYQGVEGTPGIDFPVYSHIPRTTFSCRGLESGYYADIDTDCQVFHICEEEKKISFLCPNGTIFQQSDLICEWWFKVNCSTSPLLYEESAENLRENVAKRKAFRRVHLSSQELDKTFVFKDKEVNDNELRETTQYYNDKNKKTTTTQNNNSNNNNNNNNQSLRHSLKSNKSQSPERRKPANKNNINDSQKNLLKANQKTRRFNENELGNYQNSDYDKNEGYSKETTTTLPETQNPTEQFFKGYHVQFSPPTTDSTTMNNQDKGPVYSNNNNPFKDQEVKFQTFVTKTPEKKQQNHRNNQVNSDAYDKKADANKYIEPKNSEEFQITQESASFLKSSHNNIHETSSYNPFPNHRTTYSDIQILPYVSPKVYSTISSVTPQYITTQPINNGKPFLGSRVGINIKTTKDPLFINPQVIKTNNKVQLAPDDVFKLHVISDAKNVTNSTLISPKVLEKILFAKIKPFNDSTTILPKEYESTTEQISTLPEGFSTTESFPTIITAKPTPKTNQVNQKKVTKTVTSKPFLIQYEDTPEPSNLQTRSKTPDYAVVYGSYSSTPLPSNSVQVKFNKTTNKIGIQLGKSFGSGGKTLNNNKSTNPPKPIKIQQSTSTPKLASNNNNNNNNIKNNNNKEEILVRHSSKSIPESLRESQRNQISNQQGTKGFYVTKLLEIQSTTPVSTQTTINENNNIYNIAIRSTTQQPRPFQSYTSETSTQVPFNENTLRQETNFDYKISTASPFKHLSTPEPTFPTPFRTTTPSIYENIDNMIDVLTEITKEEINTSNGRPGLIVPPSVGPQTLHSLAVYFANALDEVITKKVQNSGKLSEKFMKENKEKLTTLLTQMTVHGYNQLFNKHDNSTTANNTKSNDIKEQEFKLESPQIRQLARNFTIALSAYLNDPEMFKKDLENFRPTEPPSESIEAETTTELSSVDEELLNYSDADTKTNLPPLFTTSRPPSPTWGFIIAAKSPNDFEIENSVSHSDLNTADTQSFVPGLNDVNSNDAKSKQTTLKNIPQDHWTTSTTASNLWQTTFSINPVLFNEEFDSTSSQVFDVETSTEADPTTPESLPELGHTRQVNYELKSLPKFSFNSSEVSGILIDFMNNTTDDSNDRLHRILRKLNTTENEFLRKMKEIESNPITRRLILLLISECGKNATHDIQKHTKKNFDSIESLELSESNPVTPSQPEKNIPAKSTNEFQIYVDPNLKDDDQDTRALQLLNTLYSIASKLGK